MLYKGEACKSSINNTLSSHKETPRFFDNKYGLIYTENFLARVTALIDSEISDAECKYVLRNLFCHYTLTPCTPDETSVLPFCKEDCLAIFKKCQTPLGYSVGFVKTIIFTEKVNFVHTGLPNCSVYKFEREYDPAKKETCIRTGFFSKYFWHRCQLLHVPCWCLYCVIGGLCTTQTDCRVKHVFVEMYPRFVSSFYLVNIS